jgi:TRAP-type C4-dicarboxylate transport system permease large subunit
VNRFALALLAYAALAALAIGTLSDARVRAGTLAILAMFAVKTWIRRKEVMHSDEGHDKV